MASGLAVATLISAAVAQWSAVEWRRAAAELDLTQDTLQELVTDREVNLAEVDRVNQNLFRDHGYLEEPLTPTTLEVLNSGRSFLERYLERNRDEPQAAFSRAKAHQNLAEIDRTLGLAGQWEAGYRESRRLLQRLADQSPDPRIRTMLAATSDCLGCLLVSMGRAPEAERLASEAVTQLESLLAEDPRDTSARAELCHASRNRGLILAVLGRDGAEDVRRSIAQTQVVASQLPDEIMIAEYLVDTYQILAQLLWRQGRLDEAEEACRQSTEAIDGLLQHFRALADREGRQLHVLKYRRALATAESNLQRIRRKPGQGPSSADSWQWRPLMPQPGQVLQADLLVRGLLPGEFERQEALVLAWLDEEWCEATLAKMIAETYEHVEIVILVEDDLIEAEAEQALRDAGVPADQVRFCHVPTDTLWIRDFGPLVIDTKHGTHKCVAAQHGLFGPDLRLEDYHVAVALSRVFDLPLVPAPVLLEGGEVLSNGAGLCVVSAKVLAENARVGYSESHVTSTIERLFGATQVVYLEPLHDEPTGHVDWFATFTSADTIVVGNYRGTDPVNADLLDRHAERLARITTADGPLKVVRIPMPPRGGPRFGGTYTNVVFANGVLLVPSYPEAPSVLESAAHDVFRRLLPDWKVVEIDCRRFVARQGALHCAAINLCRGVRRPSSNVDAE